MGLVEVVVAIALVVGLVGIVVPVIPGTLVMAVATLLWALDAGTGGAWTVFAVVLVLLACGNVATYVITGRAVSASGVPTRNLALAGLAGIVGFFVVPVIGLFLFFIGALLATEYLRLRDVDAARRSAITALKATALGLLIELSLALAAVTTWFVAVLNGVGRA
jgi:uncharacterized protein